MTGKPNDDAKLFPMTGSSAPVSMSAYNEFDGSHCSILYPITPSRIGPCFSNVSLLKVEGVLTTVIVVFMSDHETLPAIVFQTVFRLDELDTGHGRILLSHRPRRFEVIHRPRLIAYHAQRPICPGVSLPGHVAFFYMPQFLF